MPKDSERAFIYETRNPSTAVTRTNGTRASSTLIRYQRTEPMITASVNRSNVESRRAPQALEPFGDNRAMVPSNRSKSTKNIMNIVPAKNRPLGNVNTATKIVNNAPTAVTILALIPTRIKPRQIGVINLVTGARKVSCSIFPIVGFVVVSDQIFPLITPNLQVCVIGKSSVEIAKYFGLSASPLEASDIAIFLVSAIDGISPADVEIWNTARELYIPSLILITDLTNGEIDFDDMSAIAGRLLDPVLTPFLVLHDDSGNPTALIDLDSLKISDYSTGVRVERDSDSEHKVLVFEFRKEYLEALEEFGQTGFIEALNFPAIPFIESNGLGSFEIATLLNTLPSSS